VKAADVELQPKVVEVRERLELVRRVVEQ
jgi:hypothetical protein